MGFSLSVALAVAQLFHIPYSFSSWYSPEPLSCVEYCREAIFGFGGRNLYRLDGKFFKKLREYPFRAKEMFCSNGKLLFFTDAGLYDEEGKILMEAPVFPVRCRQKTYILAGKQLFSVSKRKITLLPSLPRIRGDCVVAGENWAFLLSVMKFYSIDGIGKSQLLSARKDKLLSVKNGTLRLYRAGRKIWERRIEGEAVGIGFILKNFYYLRRYRAQYGEWEGELLLLDSKGEEIDRLLLAYKPTYVTSLAHFIVLMSEEGPFEIIPSDKDLSFTTNFYIKTKYVKLRDINRDGELDLLFIQESPKGWQGAGAVYFKIRKTYDLIEKLHKEALALERKLRIKTALEKCEAALAMANLTSPEKRADLLKLQRRLIKEYFLSRTLINVSPFVVLIGLLAVFGRLVFVLMGRQEAVPEDEVLEKLFNFLHKASHLVNDLRKMPDDIFKKESGKILREIEELYSKVLSLKKKFRKSYGSWSLYYRRLIKATGRLLKKPDRERVEVLYNLIVELSKRILSVKGSILEDALKPAIDMNIAYATAKDVKLEVSLDKGGKFGSLYPQKIKKIEDAFYAIIRNAIEAFEGIEREEKVVKIFGLEDVTYARVEIEDNGKGIRPEDIPKIFLYGYTKGKKGGKGVGLAGVDKLFKEMGDIKVISEPGKGTKFIIEFDASKEEKDRGDG